MPPSRLIGGQELDGLLGKESPSKEVDSSCWGRKKKKKKKSLQEDTVSVMQFNIGSVAVLCKFRQFTLSIFIVNINSLYLNVSSVDHTQKTYLSVYLCHIVCGHIFIKESSSNLYKNLYSTKQCGRLFSGTVWDLFQASPSLLRGQRCCGTPQWLSLT